MKLVEILAEEMDVWPEGVTHLTQSNVDREIYDARDGKKEDSVNSLNPRFDTRKSHTEDQYPIVTRAQWQAERDRQKGGEWKRHRGGRNQPVAGDVLVEVKLRDGDIQQAKASAFLWNHSDCDVYANIMQYRIVSQPQAEEPMKAKFDGVKLEFSRDGVNFSEIGTARIENIFDLGLTEAKTDQIDGPIKWRDTVNELDAYIEEYTRERDALIELLASEGFALIPPVVSVMSEFDGADMSDWRNWKAGDLVSSKTDYNGQFTKDKLYVVTATSVSYGSPRVSLNRDDKGEANGWMAKNFEFHSRP
jgi:hypothetical protein